MATISIQAQILSGNLGDGWADNSEAAHALAEFTRQTWEEDLSSFEDAGHEIEIGIDVQCARGSSSDVAVFVSGYDEAAAALENEVKAALTYEGTIWERFCASEEAEGLAE